MIRHSCAVPWCANGGSVDRDHWQSLSSTDYIPGRLSVEAEIDISGVTLPTVGISAATIEGEPAVIVHLTGGSHDSEADLTVADARRLRDHLDRAITNAESLLNP